MISSSLSAILLAFCLTSLLIAIEFVVTRGFIFFLAEEEGVTAAGAGASNEDADALAGVAASASGCMRRFGAIRLIGRESNLLDVLMLMMP